VTYWRESGTVKFVLVQCYWGDELSVVCGACEEGKKFIHNFEGGTCWKETRLQSGVKWVVRNWNGVRIGVTWLRTGTVVKKVTNLWIP